ncbi:MAG: tryptophan synthase subunit alpha [Anaerolineae bacterium]|nr:tryptophan synthase subunit alpha [Anaerolineae bacterium]
MIDLDKAFIKTPIFMPYFPIGYPNIPTSIDVIEALAKNGADIIEVGLSFSDPLADGPVIQKATQKALEQGITVPRALEAVAELRKRGVTIPLILMGYYNPILAYGLENLISEAAKIGINGFIIPDLPPEEAGEFETAAKKKPNRKGSILPLIRMLAPTTPADRMATITKDAQGFIYLVSVTGVTGERKEVPAELPTLISQVRAQTSVPVCVGFGISTPAHAKAVGAIADGVIVGTACIRAIGKSNNPISAAKDFAIEFKGALL